MRPNKDLLPVNRQNHPLNNDQPSGREKMSSTGGTRYISPAYYLWLNTQLAVGTELPFRYRQYRQ